VGVQSRPSTGSPPLKVKESVGGSFEMRFKLLINPILVMIVVVGALTWRHKPSTGAQQPERVDGTVKVVLKQLPVQDDVIPVEIIQPVATSSAPNVLDDVTYFVKNNSGKAISAVAVTKRILYREGGKLVANTHCSTVDFLFHSDFPSKPLVSGDQAPMEAPGPTTFEDGTVLVSVTLQINYVQYVDGSSYGGGSEGENMVLSAREGAKKYKAFLRENYIKAGKSLVTVVPLLEQDTKLDQLKLTTSESEGAARYRLYLLKTFRTKGGAEIERYIKAKE
jgi:hypothetical protein